MQTQAQRTRKAQSAHKQASLPLSEFNRIKASVAATGKASNLEEDRNRLKATCDDRMQNWSNTVLALRKKKEQDKYEKFEREELERRRIDQEEAEYQAGVKKTVMDKAKRELFERNDKVKTLHSKMLLCDVIQERGLQTEIKKHKQGMEAEIKREHHEDILRQCEEYDRKEEEKIKAMQAKREHQQEVLKHQHEVFKEKHIVRLMEDRIEGDIIKQKAKEQEIRAMHEEAERRNKIKRAQEETHKGNLLLQEIRRKEKEKELEEENKIKQYYIDREAKEKKRKEEQDKKTAEKQRIRQMMIDKAVSELQKKVDKENERLKKDIEEARIKAENVEREKREKIQRLKDTIDHHRDLFMRDKAIKKDKEHVEDKNFQAFWKDKNKAIVVFTDFRKRAW
jgi:hypothetical protein